MSESRRWVIRALLEDMGFGLSELACAVGYPVAALRTFQAGRLDSDPTTFDDIRGKLLDIITMTVRLGLHRGKSTGDHEEAALFGSPIVEGYTAIGWDLYTIGDGARCRHAPRGEPYGGHNGLCALAQGEEPGLVLERFVPDWRTRFWTDYETFLDTDGHLSIRAKRS